MSNYLIVAVHPDDETLGAGGTILKKKKEGHKVFVLNITNMSVEYGFAKEKTIKRENDILKMITKYDLDGYFNLNLEPAGLSKYDENELITEINKVIVKVRPNIIILPYYKDAHSDHRIIFKILHACTKVFRHSYIKKTLMMETISETDFSIYGDTFSPNYFIDISEYINEKINIAKIYEDEMSTHPFPRNEELIEAYGKIRGSMAGCRYAEAFEVIKIIEE